MEVSKWKQRKRFISRLFVSFAFYKCSLTAKFEVVKHSGYDLATVSCAYCARQEKNWRMPSKPV